MDWITTQNSSNQMTNQSGQRMSVWFMPVVFGIALLVAVVVVLVMCIRWRQLRSSANNASQEEEEGYEEISAKTSSRRIKRNTDKDDYETIPVMLKKTPKNTNKNNDREYKMLTSVRPQHEREYASLNKATCSSKTSLSSLSSGCDVKEDRSKNRTKRQGLVIPSLSNPIEEPADRVCVSQARSLEDIATQSTKQVKRVKTLRSQPGSKIANLGVDVNQQNSSIVTRAASMKPKPGVYPKPYRSQKEIKKNVRKIQYENATVVIDGDKTETLRISLEKKQ
ncbi:uncharacterized protein LOC116287768 [Actinia tenebrosa]|uniref:Uncharacterized protein LOC116287768 n=1 Tax=Actinia tenebrosa TaxID=6105 RepID=A0A6P8H1P3_ACTTE|nr:uncharacterized protein LOC116287768 [Actinia tenebrosa]